MSALIAIFALGVLPSAAAYILYFHAVSRLGTTRAAISNYLIPPIGILTGMLVLGEHPDLVTGLAFALVVCALTIGLSDRIWPRQARTHQLERANVPSMPRSWS